MQEPPVIGQKPSGEYRQPKRPKLYELLDNRWAVLAAIFFAMMFLGLPLLWRCPGFTRFEKLVWTIIVLIHSALIFWAFYSVMAWCYGQVSDAMGW